MIPARPQRDAEVEVTRPVHLVGSGGELVDRILASLGALDVAVFALPRTEEVAFQPLMESDMKLTKRPTSLGLGRYPVVSIPWPAKGRFRTPRPSWPSCSRFVLRSGLIQ